MERWGEEGRGEWILRKREGELSLMMRVVEEGLGEGGNRTSSNKDSVGEEGNRSPSIIDRIGEGGEESGRGESDMVVEGKAGMGKRGERVGDVGGEEESGGTILFCLIIGDEGIDDGDVSEGGSVTTSKHLPTFLK
jgi:hypothetical protein